jgi:hypothetical protein
MNLPVPAPGNELVSEKLAINFKKMVARVVYWPSSPTRKYSWPDGKKNLDHSGLNYAQIPS